eukprot:11223611-Lingulodinium_polyedra.AAC.1
MALRDIARHVLEWNFTSKNGVSRALALHLFEPIHTVVKATLLRNTRNVLPATVWFAQSFKQAQPRARRN